MLRCDASSAVIKRDSDRPSHNVHPMLLRDFIPTVPGPRRTDPFAFAYSKIGTGRMLLIREAKSKLCVHRVIEVKQRYGVVVAKPCINIVTHTHKVDAGQQRVIHLTGGNLLCN